MKRSKMLKIMMMIIATSLTLTACDPGSSSVRSTAMGSASPGTSFDSAYESAYMDNGIVEVSQSVKSTSSSGAGDQHSQTENLKLIRTVNMDLEVETDQYLKPAVNDLIQKAHGLGGYASYNNIDAYEMRASANLELKIPKNKVDQFLDDVNGSYKVNSLSDRSEDVTTQYIDTETRLQVKEAARDKYMGYLEAAENVTELLEIEDRLNDTIEDIESSKAVLKSLDNRIDYTAISIYIGCKDITYKESYAQKVGDRMKEIFESCGDNLIDGFEWMLQALIVCLYSLPILFIVVRFFLFAINRKHSIKGLFQRRKKRKEESKNEIKTEE